MNNTSHTSIIINTRINAVYIGTISLCIQNVRIQNVSLGARQAKDAHIIDQLIEAMRPPGWYKGSLFGCPEVLGYIPGDSYVAPFWL